MSTPPKPLLRLLEFICPEHLYEEIAGDLLQRFNKDRTMFSEGKAKRRFFWSAIRFFRPGIILRNKFSTQLRRSYMFQNYFKTTLRLLSRNKVYAFINIFGLAIGIASAILILLWVEDENTSNHFIPNHENIYQVKANSTYDGVVHTDEDLSLPAYNALKSIDNRIKNVCYTGWTYGHSIAYNNKPFNKEGLAVSKEFLEMFDLPLVSGSWHSLDDPYSIMLNESTAKEIFGDEDPVGKMIRWDKDYELKVTGVYKDVPWSSTLWFMCLVPASFYDIAEEWTKTTGKDWSHLYYHVYVETQPHSNIAEIDGVIKDMLKVHVKDDLNHEIFLHGMDRWRLHGNFENGKEAGGKIEYVRLFTWIGILTLLIACINYMNLATARSERRAKEVGIRKSIGSHRSELVTQFLLESFIITAVSFLLAIVLVKLCLPGYNTMINKKLVLDVFSVDFILLSASIIVVTALLSGCYPAFYFSSFQPVKVLKGKIIAGRNALMPRNILVASQYVFAIFLVIGMIVIYQQIQHVKNRELGYDQENLIMVPFNDEIVKNYSYAKNELIKSGLVESMSRSNMAIYQDAYDEFVDWEGKPTIEKTTFKYFSCDYDFVTTNRLSIIDGRDFSEEISTDSSNVLINQTAARRMGYDNPVGRTIKFRNRSWTIIGVVKDVVNGSPFEPVDPLFIAILPGYKQYLTLRMVKTKDLSAQVAQLDALLRKINPSNAPEIMFAGESYEYRFSIIKLIGKLANMFAMLAIALTVLGVLGLAAYTAEQRTKEMAIRKVLGASLNQLLFLLSHYFVKIALIALFIAAPISWWGLDRYLSNYSYRIDIPWWSIPLTAMGILIITLLIVFTQVARAAAVNPVNSLKNE